MDFGNSTDLDSALLEHLFVRHTLPYRHDRLRVRVRYSHGAPFSGTCYYDKSRIFVNLGRDLRFPYRLGTHVARSKSNRTHWWRETYQLIIEDPYQLALFVYLHELYHCLVNAAKRNPRRKEAMCDRFAARKLADAFGCRMVDGRGRPVPRDAWDFQDLHRFIAAAPKVETLFDLQLPPAPRDIPVLIHGLRSSARRE